MRFSWEDDMREQPRISRRRFAGYALVGSPSLLIAWRSIAGQTPSAADKKTKRLLVTESQEAGPYHRDGAPWTTALAKSGEKGRPLSVSGTVLGEDTGSPLPDALLDVWQADASGNYDFQDNPAPASPVNYRMRGMMLADKAGRYAFTSVVPGNYGTSPSAQRAKHVHYLINRSGYEPLITQLYFDGDPWNTRDPLVRRSLIMPVREAQGGGAAVTFDIVLRRESPVDLGMLRSFEDYLGEYQLTASSDTLRVEWRNGRLGVTHSLGDKAELRPRGGTRFFAPEWAADLTFVRNENGTVAEVICDLDDGKHARAKKVR
jgi:catechol 1,2-dioxygenase